MVKKFTLLLLIALVATAHIARAEAELFEDESALIAGDDAVADWAIADDAAGADIDGIDEDALAEYALGSDDAFGDEDFAIDAGADEADADASADDSEQFSVADDAAAEDNVFDEDGAIAGDDLGDFSVDAMDDAYDYTEGLEDIDEAGADFAVQPTEREIKRNSALTIIINELNKSPVNRELVAKTVAEAFAPQSASAVASAPPPPGRGGASGEKETDPIMTRSYLAGALDKKINPAQLSALITCLEKIPAPIPKQLMDGPCIIEAPKK